MKLKINFSCILIFIEVVLFIFFLFLRYKLGLVRYFDADEFAHLHWGYSFFIGEKPFTDFFYLFPPFFLYPISFLFLLFGRTITAVLSARVFIFFIFVATSLLLILLGKKIRNLHVGILSALLFSFLPLPTDKMIEVRPDLVATFFALFGLYIFLIAQEKEKKRYFFLSGLLFAVSLGFSPKMMFFLLPIALVVTFDLFQRLKSYTRTNQSLKGIKEEMKKRVIPLVAGFAIPIMGIILLVFSFGNPSRSFYSMTRMAAEVTKDLGRKFYMRPDLFFYPNESYYGMDGYNRVYFTNLFIYLVASLWAIFRFVSALSHADDKQCLREFLVGATFFVNLYAFVAIYPLKHAQYLIPVAPFIAFYFADFLVRRIIPGVLLLVFILYLVPVGNDIYIRKMQWTNARSLDKLATYLKVIPPKTPIFDLTGESIFFPNGYYFCCLPYGQYEGAILFRIPDLARELERRRTEYIHVSWDDRLNVLPALQQKYIREYFIPSDLDPGLLMRKEK